MTVLLICLLGVNVSFIECAPYTKGIIESQDGTYRIAIDRIPDAEVFKERMSLLKDGTPVWDKEHHSGDYYYVSNTGCVVSKITINMNAVLAFHDRTGVIRNVINIPSACGGTFTNSGEFFFFLSGSEGLYMFDNTGAEIDNFGVCNKYTVSDGGHIVTVIRDNRLIVHNNGMIVWETSIPSVHLRAMVMSHDGSLLSLIDNKYVWVFDISAKKEIFRKEIPNPVALAISPEGSLFAIAREERDITSTVTVLLLNIKNKLLWQWSHKFNEACETVHGIEITDGSELHVYSTDDLFRFAVQ